MLPTRIPKFLFLIFVTLVFNLVPLPATAQDESETNAAAREKAIAERFMQVLMRRPAPGTALDRVYGYHVQSGTLDEILEQLGSDIESGAEDAGAKAMLLGLMQLQRGSDAAAAESLATAERLRPDDAVASYQLGKSLLLVGRGDAAAEAFERAIERKPARNEALPVFTELGRIYSRSQQTEKALAVWTRLEKAFPGDVRVGEQIAQTLAEEGQNEAALQRFETLAQKTASTDDARSIGYRIAAAELKRKVGRFDDALTDFESLLTRLRPSSWLHSDVQRRIEAGFLRSGDYSALAGYYAKQVDKQPDALELRLRLGQVQSKAGLLDDAEKTLRATVALAPTQTEPRLALVDLLQATANHAGAAEQLRILVQQDSENPDYLIRLGSTILEDSEKPKATRDAEAAEVWQQLATARNDDAVIIAQVGDLMRRIDRNDDAIELYQTAIRLEPEQAQYREYLGEFFNQLGRKDEAMQVWNSIAEDERETRENLIRLAEVLNTFDHPDKALEAFARAAEKDPTFSQRLRFTELLSRAEKYDDALSQLDSAQTDAESPEEREQLLLARIGIYASSGTLDERIKTARTKAATDPSPESYRRLALMLDAGSKTDEAMVAIESGMAEDASDIGAMEVAAELYRKSSRSTDAITVYRRLAEVDVRFLPNYLKRISSLHMELGQVDESLAAADELIQAGPGNPESYRFYAEQCFRVGRDDEGIDRLRRALRAAPRDRDARRALASALDTRFRTDEAIELYWALLEDTDDLADQRGLVKSLADLYGRKGDFDRLLSRLELRGRETSDMRAATLLISESHRSMDDLGAAIATLEPLLAENPPDAELIAQLVNLSEAADDLDAALQYQEQLTQLADTPENRNREINLMITMGMMDRVEAALQRTQGSADPLNWIATIERAMGRDDMVSAQRFCEMALEKDSSLWEIRTRLAALLIFNGELDRAEVELDRITALTLPDETVSNKSKNRTTSGRSRSNQQGLPPIVAASNTAWLSRVVDVNQLAYFLRIGSYANATFNFGDASRGAPDPGDVGHAKMIADALRMVLADKRSEMVKFVESQQLDDLDRIKSLDDPEELRRMMLYSMFVTSFQSPTFNPMSDPAAVSSRMGAIIWRLIETSTEAESLSLAANVLESRAETRRGQERGVRSKELEPLTQEQFATLEGALDLEAARGASGHVVARNRFYAAGLYQEMKAAGMDDRAAELRESMQVEIDSISDAIMAMGIAANFGDGPERIEEIWQLVNAEFPKWSKSATPAELQQLLSILTSRLNGQEEENEPDDKTLLQSADLNCAIVVLINQGKRTSSGRTRGFSQSAGMLNTSISSGNNNIRLQLQVPLTGDATFTELVQSLAKLGVLQTDSPIYEKLLAHWKDAAALLTDRPELADQEMLLRKLFLAYSHWWDKQPAKTYDALVEISNEDPENDVWWIERARLAAELKMPGASLEALDSINPMDQGMLQIRELAAMNLSTQLGDFERAKLAARRLFGMRLDKTTELALADQLTRLGMKEMAAAVLQRSRRRGGQTVSELLSLADRYTATQDNDAAAEVAYSAMRKMSRGGERNEDYYRRRAVEILRQAGRLDSTIAQAESRVASSPDSLSLKSELASLYTAAGRKDDADNVFAEIATLESDDPKSMWAMAESLTAAGKHDEALMKYVAASVKDPALLSSDSNRLIRSLREVESREKAYEGLMELKINGLRSYIVGQLSSVRGRRGSDQTAGKFEEAFLAKVLKESPIESLGYVLRSLQRTPERMQSKDVVDSVRRLVKNPALYESAGGIWRQGSFGTDGRFSGMMEPCFKVIELNENLKKETRELFEAKVRGEKDSAITELLLVVLDVDKGATEKAITKLAKLMKRTGNEIPMHAWRQFGQLIEDDKSWIESGCVVDVYEKARDVDDGSNRMNGYQYSVGPRLTDAYLRVGRKVDAKRELLNAYANIDHSADNRQNPGYGDAQNLESTKSIADKLVEFGSRLAAIPLYSDALADPDRFERAKRWGRSSNGIDMFRNALKQTLRELNEDDFDEYLSLTEPDADEKTEDVSAIDLMPMVPTSKIDPMNSSVAAHVAAHMLKTESGREKLVEFEKLASERLTQTAGDDFVDTSLIAVTAIVATVLKQESAPERFQQITELIPTVDASGKRQVADERIMGLYSPILVGLTVGDESTRRSAALAADKLSALADSVERPVIGEVLLLNKLQHAAGEGISEEEKLAIFSAMLDRVAPASTPPKLVSMDTAQDCLRIAEIAVEAEVWPVAIDAIGRAIGGGPPLRTLGNAGQSGATFLPTTSRNNSTPEPTLAPIAGLMVRVLEVLKRCENPMREDSLLAEAAYRSLADVVMPPNRSDEIFPYLVDLIEPRRANPFNNQYMKVDFDPASVSRSLVQAAALSGKTAELESRLAERRGKTEIASLVDLIGVQLAIQQDDASVLATATERLARSTGVLTTLEGADDSERANIGAAAPDYNGTVRRQSKADMKSALQSQSTANVLLHTMMPLHAREGMSLPVISISKRLLSLAAEDSGVAQAFEKWEWIVIQFFQDESIEEDTAGELLDLYLKGTRQRFSKVSKNNTIEEQFVYYASRFVQPAIDSARFTLAARCQRMDYESRLGRGNALDESFWPLSIGLADAASRYDFFETLLFGVEGQAPETTLAFLRLDQWLAYAEPPAVLNAAAPNLAACRSQGIAAPDFPLDSIGQSIAIAAAGCERTDELIDRLKPLVQHPGDEVDSVIGIALLVAGRIEEAGEVVDRVAARLRETVRTGKFDSSMMDDSAALLVRAYEFELLRESVVSAWPSVQPHFRNREIGNRAGYYNQVGTRILPSFAYGASVDHGLDHFAAYHTPDWNFPVDAFGAPTWIVRDGTLRYGGGMDLNMMMLKYPLSGDFKFTFREVEHPSGSFAGVAGGQIYHAKAWNGTAHVQGVINRGQKEWPFESGKKSQDNVNILQFEDNIVRFVVNGKRAGESIRSSAFPFVGLLMKSYGDCEAADLAITGDVTIPRVVNMIDEELRGWSCPYHNGNLPTMTLRTDVDEVAEFPRKTDPDAIDNLAWRHRDGGIATGGQTTSNTPGGCRHVQYQRPLLDGETITYETQYEAGQKEVHPTIGRVAVMIRPSGVKLRWLIQSSSLETLDAKFDTEVDPDEVLVESGIELTASTKVTLTAEGDRCTVTVNGTPVCCFTMALDRRPGLLCEKDRFVHITSMELTGDWPETLPENLLEAR